MADITLLDGSIGQELVKRSGDRPTPLWSTQVMIDHPNLVREVHRDYFAAGATIASTNTYAVLRDRLKRVDIEHKFEYLTNTAVSAARQAQVDHGEGRVAGILGPLVASYRPDLCPPPVEAAQIYAENVEVMKDSVDLFMLETMCSVEQAEGTLRAAYGQGLPVWLAVSVNDDDGRLLRSGEPVFALRGIVDQYEIDAVLVNCSRPEAIPSALDGIADFGLPYGAFANGFTKIADGFLVDAPTVDALEQRTDMGPEVYADHAMAWVDHGATIVGGCCEVGPAHILAIAERLRESGHRIV